MSIVPNAAYWAMLDNEFWPVLAVSPEEEVEGLEIPENDGQTYQVVRYFTGELGAIPVQQLSEFAIDNNDKFRPENPEIVQAIDLAFQTLYHGEYSREQMERDAVALAADTQEPGDEAAGEDEPKKKGHKDRDETEEERKARRDAKKARIAEKEAKKKEKEEKKKKEKEKEEAEKKKEKQKEKKKPSSTKRGRDAEEDEQIQSASESEGGSDDDDDEVNDKYEQFVGGGDFSDNYAGGLDRRGPRDRHADPATIQVTHVSNTVALAKAQGVDRSLLSTVESNYDHVLNRVRADAHDKLHNQIAGGGTLATDATNKYGRMVDPLMLPEGKHEYVKKAVKREEDIARWTAIVEAAAEAEGGDGSKRSKKTAVPKDEDKIEVEEPIARARRPPPRTITIDSRVQLPEAIPDAIPTNLVGRVHGASIPAVSETEFPRSRLLKEEEKLDRGNQLMSLKAPAVMNTWLALRDRVEVQPQDVHAVRAFGATASQYDRPQAKLAEKAAAYSKKRQVDLPKSQRGSGTMTQLGMGGEGAAGGSAADQQALLAGYSQNGMDYSDFQFNQTLDVMKQKSLQEMVPIESARVQQPSSNYFPDSQRMGGETQEAAEKSAGHFATESEKYELPGSIFHRSGAGGDSMPYNETQSLGGSQKPASTAGTRGNAEAVSSRKRFRESAAKIVTLELTPYFKGSLGKPMIIDSLEEFKTLARKLTDRALEGKLHRSGEALATPAQRIIVCTTNDKKNLTVEIRDYMENLAKKKSGRH